jgi:Nitronate monooxygenase
MQQARCVASTVGRLQTIHLLYRLRSIAARQQRESGRQQAKPPGEFTGGVASLNMDIADRLRLDVPVGQAGMGGGLAGASLAAAVAKAGALGTIGIATPRQLRMSIDQVREQAPGRAVAVNLLMPFARRHHVAVCCPIGGWTAQHCMPVKRRCGSAKSRLPSRRSRICSRADATAPMRTQNRPSAWPQPSGSPPCPAAGARPSPAMSGASPPLWHHQVSGPGFDRRE